jgi:ABC-2 type transport system ATP-binding protein
MVIVQNLHKSFREIRAVDGVSFEIRKGTIHGLLGPNGAGKTTTISMLAGVLAPDSGTVTIGANGSPMSPAVRAAIGSAPQALALYDELTARENLTFFGKLYGLGGQSLRQRVASCLDLVGLTERQKSRVATFSGGMKRRLNLACAIIHDPEILLLDEPTVGVDPQSRNLIFERIEQLRDRGLTILYTTHYMEEAQRLCDEVAIMDHGKILAEGPVESLISRYGGASVVHAEIGSKPPTSINWPGDLDEMHLRFESTDPMGEIARLNRQGVTFQSLHLERADLESVFLNLTGRSLRD